MTTQNWPWRLVVAVAVAVAAMPSYDNVSFVVVEGWHAFESTKPSLGVVTNPPTKSQAVELLLTIDYRLHLVVVVVVAVSLFRSKRLVFVVHFRPQYPKTTNWQRVIQSCQSLRDDGTRIVFVVRNRLYRQHHHQHPSSFSSSFCDWVAVVDPLRHDVVVVVVVVVVVERFDNTVVPQHNWA